MKAQQSINMWYEPCNCKTDQSGPFKFRYPFALDRMCPSKSVGIALMGFGLDLYFQPGPDDKHILALN